MHNITRLVPKDVMPIQRHREDFTMPNPKKRVTIDPASPTPAQLCHDHPTTEATQNYLLDPSHYPTPASSLAPTPTLCSNCGLFPPIETSELCDYCVSNFTHW